MKKIIFILLTVCFRCFAEEYEYTVVKGDCLWDIAKKFYNNPFLWKEIYKANQHKIKNPDLIYPGQVFILPYIDVYLKSSTEESTEIEVSEEQQVLQRDYEELFVKAQSEYKVAEEEQTINNIKEEIISKDKHKEEKFAKTIRLKNFKTYGKIISAEEEKFVYIDFDKVYCQLKENVKVNPGEILGIYHLGPSKYDVNLMKIPKDQLTLVGKAKVIKILKDNQVLCEVIRAYSPIVIGDFITLAED